MSSTPRSTGQRFLLLAVASSLLGVVGSQGGESTTVTQGAPSSPVNASPASNVTCHMTANVSVTSGNVTCKEETSTPNSPASDPNTAKADYVGYVIVPLLLVTGLCGNMLTVVVMTSKYFRHMSVSLLLIALACSDTILILLIPFNKLFVINLIGVDIRATSLSSCKAFFFFWRCAKMTSSWFIVLICTERFVAVWFPLKTALICTKRNTLIAILCVYVVMFSYNGSWTFASALIGGKCEPHHSTPETKQASHGFLIAGTMLYSIVPTILLLIMTPSICYKLVVQGRRRRAMASAGGDGQKGSETSKTNAMLIGVSLAFIVLVAPVSTAHSVSFLGGESFFYSKDLGMTVLRETAQVMEQLNYSINFFLYVICSGSFRKRIITFFGCKAVSKSNKKAVDGSGAKTTKPSSAKDQACPKSSSSPKHCVSPQNSYPPSGSDSPPSFDPSKPDASPKPSASPRSSSSLSPPSNSPSRDPSNPTSDP